MYDMRTTPPICAGLVAMFGSALSPAQAQPRPPAIQLLDMSSGNIGWVVGIMAVLLLLACLWLLALQLRLRHQTRQMRESERRLNTILDSVDACIYIKDSTLRYTYANRQLCERFNTSISELIGSSDSKHFPAHIFSRIRTTDLRVVEEGQRVACEEEVPGPGGVGLETFLSVKTPIRNAEGRVTALCGVSTNITELLESRAAVHRLAYYDPLTDLPNRRMLQERMEEALLLRKNLGPIAAILFIDLDKFKNINDERGHEVGDAVLRAIAHRLQRVARNEDTVARLGGDEFVILLQNLGDELELATDQALDVAEKVRQALEEAVSVGDQRYFTRGSIGVALLDSSSKSVADALREADTAMYQSKERGRNRVALYRHDMHIQLAERARMLRDLAGAIPNNQLRMMVQPQYDADGQVVGAELLLRWHHPQHGLIMPEKFIGLAEESGLIIEVGEWTLTQACKMYVRLAQAQCAHPISVNVSPVQLKHPGFSQRVSDILAHWDMPPDRLTLEVTEDVLIKDIDETTRCMHALAGQGLRFSIDDFGTGYSGLAYLHRLPLAELKIPKNFVEKLPDEDAGTLIRLITSTARLLELRVVAEGVERAVEAEFLFATGCDAMQGYYHQRPTPMERWVASRLASAQRGIEKHHGNESQHEAAGSP